MLTFLPILASSHYELVVHLASARPVELDALFWAVADPNSAKYAQHVSADELRHLAGGTPAAAAEAGAWLSKLGGSNVLVSPLGDRVTASFDADADKDASRWTARGLPLASSKPPSAALVVRRDFDKPPATLHRPMVEAPDFGPSVNDQKAAYGIPKDLAATDERTIQMVWGPGTFGFKKSQLRAFKAEQDVAINLDKVKFDTANHGRSGGDNFGEGSLDVRQISSFGLNATTLVSNTNTSSSTEEGQGFGLAMLDFVSELASRASVPQVLSLSLGSLSPTSCDKLCDEATKQAGGAFTLAACRSYLQTQRQVCMFESPAQAELIDRGLQALGLRGVTVVGSSGDGGSHWSFGPFEGFGAIPTALNKVGCEFMFPIYPSPSPYMLSIGGTSWQGDDPSKPVAWRGSGGGFSWQFGAPAHQHATVASYLGKTAGLPPASSYNASGRGYPDVSAISADGTSQSSPTVGGIFSLLVDARLRAGLPPLGFVGTRVWQVAAAHPGEAFEDVTVGNSKTSCDNGFPATEGWDPVTGWGRPKWDGLIKYFGSAP